MSEPTPLQQARWDVYQRHGGDRTRGAQANAARELGVSDGTLHSSIAGYRARVGDSGHVAKHHRPARPTELMRDLPAALVGIDTRLASLIASQAAMSVQLIDLAREIRAWTRRQPILVNMGPRNKRVVDGGEGGGRETRRLRRAASE